MANYNFNKDILLGEDGEATVVKYLESKGGKLVTDNKNNEYDVIINYKGNEIKYEIKTDVFCTDKLDTGNLFIEFECRGKPSGITVTKAKWFVTYYKHLGEIWFIETDKLLELINRKSFRTTKQSGDVGSNTKGYLINRKRYKELFKVKYV